MKGNKMKSIADLQAEHAAQVAKLSAEHDLAAALPLVPDSVLLSHGKRAPWASFNKRTLTQALDVIGAFQIVPLFRYRGTFCEIVPEGAADPKATEDGGPYALAMDVSTVSGSTSAKLFFYTVTPDGRSVRINIGIEGPAYIGNFPAFAGSVQPIAWDRRGTATDWRVGPSPALAGMADSYVQWAETSKRDGRHTYLFAADCYETAPAAEMTHALGMLANLRDEFQPEAELIETTAAGAYWRLPSGSYVVTKPGAPAPAWGHGYTLEFCKSVTEPKESAK